MTSNGVRYQELFSKRRFIFFVLTFLIGLQLICGFLSPSYGSGGNIWEPIDALVSKFASGYSDNFLLSKIYPLISPRYSLYTDASYYLELGRNFSPERLNGHMFAERPLWPFLIFLSSLPARVATQSVAGGPVRFFETPSYAVIFGLAILLNFILMAASVLLFFSLVRRLFSLKTAWLSSILLIFSPFVRNYLSQPLAEILMVFSIISSVYLLDNYVRKPTAIKLALFSLIVGTLMLGKIFFATSFFILLLSFYFRRYREGIIFGAVHLAPYLLWYVFATQVWRINFWFYAAQKPDAGFWLLNVLRGPWPETYRVLLNALPDFITALIYSFLLIPVFFSIIGWQKLPFKSKNIIYFGAIFSVFLLGFSTAYFAFRHIFLLFPIIYPTCVLGIGEAARRLKVQKPWPAALFYVVIIGLIILISNINIHQIFNYNQDIRLL